MDIAVLAFSIRLTDTVLTHLLVVQSTFLPFSPNGGINVFLLESNEVGNGKVVNETSHQILFQIMFEQITQIDRD